MIEKHILLDLPNQIFSKNLTIRPIVPGDSNLIYDAIVETYDQLCNWFSWAREINNIQDVEVNCRKFYAEG
jgi:hypothetical protein